MKFSWITGYFSQSDIAGLLFRCGALSALGSKREVQGSLIEFFEKLKPNGAAGSDANTRRRNRMIGDAANWLADSFISESQIDHGVIFFRKMLKKNPGCNALYGGLSRLIFRGDDYIKILKSLHKKLRPEFYVEIGLAKGDTLTCAMPSTYTVGVDPNPDVRHRFGANTVICAETSDAFFAAYENRPQFADRKIDLAFIDGLHHFEQALRDFINIEKRATPDGLIVFHDCIPLDEASSGRDNNGGYWAGDVWKTLAILMDHRPDLDIKIIGAPPSGLVLVRRLIPDSRHLEQKFATVVDAYSPLGFADWESKYAPQIRIIPSYDVDIAGFL